MVDEKQPPRRASLGVVAGDKKTGKAIEDAADTLSADAADAEAAYRSFRCARDWASRDSI